MNKILIVGHPASGYPHVETLLNRCGMQPALPSRRDGLLPPDVTATLCKAHKAPPVQTVLAEEDFKQIDAGAIWHGMALDLMLGNLDQTLWGWSDPHAIYTLDYWEELDPKLTFVFVYDEPQRAVMEAARNDAGLPGGQAVQQMLDNWTAYNAAMLRFFLRHPGRCLLVHSEQVRRAVDAYLQQLQPLLDTPLALAATPALGIGRIGDAPHAPADDGASEALATPQVPLPIEAPPSLPARFELAIAQVGLDVEEAALLLDAGSAERYLLDGVLSLHPAAQQLYAELQSAANLPLERPDKSVVEPAVAWIALLRQRAFVSRLVEQLQAEYQHVQEELTEVSQRAEAEAASSRDQVMQFAAQAAAGEEVAKARAVENDLLLTQLHEVQEELEKHYLRKQELEQRSAQLERDTERQAVQASAALEAEKAAGAKAMADLCKKLDVQGGQLSAAQARLEAEIEGRANAVSEQKAAAANDTKLKELSDENDLLLTQLHQVQEELERYYLDNQRLRQKLSPPKRTVPSGAVLRVKRQLSYRLGATMIQQSRSVGGWLSMPWALAAEARAFRKERAARPAEKLPPLHAYCDAHEAERVKQHLSYQLGQTLLKHGKSPVGWLKLPFALRREMRQFRLRRQQLQGA